LTVDVIRQRRLLQGLSVAVLGLVVACAPMAVASASNNNHGHKAKSHHHTSKPKAKAKAKAKTASKGSDPTNTICMDVKNSESSSSTLGPAIEKAIEGGATGSFASLQQELLTELNAPLKSEGAALAALSSAPANVQAAMKNLISFDGTFKSAIASATSLTQLEGSLATIAANAPALQADAMTLTNYVTSLCGSSLTPTT
jgi:hypothetical protein